MVVAFRPALRASEDSFSRLVEALGEAQAIAIRDEGCTTLILADLAQRERAGRPTLLKDEPGFRFDRCHF